MLQHPPRAITLRPDTLPGHFTKDYNIIRLVRSTFATELLDVKTQSFLQDLEQLVAAASPYSENAKTAMADDPDLIGVWYNPSADAVVYQRDIDDVPLPGFVGLALSPAKTGCYFEKIADVSNTDKLVSLLGWNDRYYKTNPVIAMLATGVLGAGLGYGGASLLSPLVPQSWDSNGARSKMRRNGLLLGLAAGMAPGALEVAKSKLINQPIFDGSHMRSDKTKKADFADFGPNAIPRPRYHNGPIMNSDEFLQTVWALPPTMNTLSQPQRTLLTGMVGATQQVAGTPWIGPADFARMTAGAGIGYASGLLAGKVLGSLVGLPKPAQQTLAMTGMYANVAKSVLPLFYGGIR